MDKANQLGAITALGIYGLIIMMFVSRLLGRPRVGYWLGLGLVMLAIPLAGLLLTAPKLARPSIYYIQLGLMIVFLAVELMLDYILEINFRQVRWMVIGYVTLFFAATGGMLGVATLAGREYAVVAVTMYLTMAALAFVQRAITGM